jgi:hypothetical protein
VSDQSVQSGKQNTFQVSGTALIVRLELDPRAASSQDDRYILYTSDDDSVYSRTLTVKDDCEVGDPFVTLRFDELPADHTYSLKIEPGGDAEPYHLFEDVPLDELLSEDFVLEGSGAAEDEDDAERPEGAEETLPDTEDAVSWDVDEEDDDSAQEDDEEEETEDEDSGESGEETQPEEEDTDQEEPEDEDEEDDAEEDEEEEEEQEEEEEDEAEEDEEEEEEMDEEEEEETDEDEEPDEDEERNEDEELENGR